MPGHVWGWIWRGLIGLERGDRSKCSSSLLRVGFGQIYSTRVRSSDGADENENEMDVILPVKVPICHVPPLITGMLVFLPYLSIGIIMLLTGLLAFMHSTASLVSLCRIVFYSSSSSWSPHDVKELIFLFAFTAAQLATLVGAPIIID